MELNAPKGDASFHLTPLIEFHRVSQTWRPDPAGSAKRFRQVAMRGSNTDAGIAISWGGQIAYRAM